jgi:hypothetical protein
MKKINLIISFLLCLIIEINAQQLSEQGFAGSTATIRFNNMTLNPYTVLEGSPYSSVEFKDGSILPSQPNAKWISGYKLRYNSYANQLEFEESNVIKKVFSTDIKAFKIGEAIYQSGFPAIDKYTLNSFYKVLYKGKVKLLKISTTLLQEVRAADDVKQGDKFTTYDYYYLLENEEMKKFFTTKKAFLKVISPAKISAVEAFINDKKLKLKDENDFVEVVKFYDSL